MTVREHALERVQAFLSVLALSLMIVRIRIALYEAGEPWRPLRFATKPLPADVVAEMEKILTEETPPPPMKFLRLLFSRKEEADGVVFGVTIDLKPEFVRGGVE